MTQKIGAIQMAAELGMRRPSVFGDEDYIREIIAAYNRQSSDGFRQGYVDA